MKRSLDWLTIGMWLGLIVASWLVIGALVFVAIVLDRVLT